MEEATTAIELGKYGIPVILSVFLGLIYRTFPNVPNRVRPWIAVILGMGLSMVALFYAGKDPNLVNVVDYLMYGFMGVGASAVGLYELQKGARGS